jgi:hypothetical protein
MKQAVQIYGPPDSVRIDNGRDYDSQLWTGTTKEKRKVLGKGYLNESWLRGLYGMMDVEMSFTIPYHPQSKPIERWFDTLDMQFTKTMPTYCGKDTKRRPDYLKDLLGSERAIAEAYDLTGFTQLIDKYIEAYNRSAHGGAGMEGKSPAEVLAARKSKRVILTEVLELLMRVWTKELQVGKNGVRFNGLYYGQYNPQLLACQGRKVRLAYDPEDVRQIYVYDSVTLKLVTMAEQNELVHYGAAVNEEALRAALRKKAGAIKIVREYGRVGRAYNTDLPSLAIEARQGEQRVGESEQAGRTLRPVRTPLDGQADAHKRLAVKAGRKSKTPVLNFDFDALKPKNPYEGMKIFKDVIGA